MNKLTRLRNIVQEVSQARELNEALQIIAVQVREAMQVDACSVYLTDNSRGSHILKASEGLGLPLSGNQQLAFDEGLVGLVAERSEPVNERNAPFHPRFSALSDAGDNTLLSFLGVPIVHHGNLLGVLTIQRSKNQRFKETDVAFLATLAAQLSGKILLASAYSSISGTHQRSGTQHIYIEGGIGAPGVSMGVGVVIYSRSAPDQVPDQPVQDEAAEISAFQSAVEHVAEEFELISNDSESSLTSENRALFGVYAMIARSSELVDSTVSRIRQGNWAPASLRDAIQEYAQVFDAMEDPYLKERGNDIRDIGRRILSRLLREEQTEINYPERTILVGENLGPVDLAAVPEKKLAAVISA